MSGPRAPKPSPLAGEGAERRRREAGEGAFVATTDRARVLRARLTDAERKLWYALRGGRFAGAKFRQVPVGPYVADFLCYEARLVIEVDGGQHAQSARMCVAIVDLRRMPFVCCGFGTTTCILISRLC